MPERQERAVYNVYMVCYRAAKTTPVARQQALIDAIKLSPGWAKYFESSWLLATTENASGVFRRLKPHITPADFLLVIRADEHEAVGRLPTKGWDWLKSVRDLNAPKES